MKRIQKSQRTAEVKDNNSQEGKGNVICIFFVIFPYSDRLDRLDLNILWQNIIEFSGPEKVNDRLPVDGCPSWGEMVRIFIPIYSHSRPSYTHTVEERVWIDKYGKRMWKFKNKLIIRNKYLLWIQIFFKCMYEYSMIQIRLFIKGWNRIIFFYSPLKRPPNFV